MKEIFAKLRDDYASPALLETDLPADPLQAFQLWFAEATDREESETNAMTLATASADGRPSARIVLLKELDSRGFVFFTNYESRKGRELTENPRAALVFFWSRCHRQVRIEGSIQRVEASESDLYFAARPRGAQLGAWASRQSQVVASRPELDQIRADVETQLGSATIGRPPYWGGFRLLPEMLEFWQGRPDRMHDRIVYERSSTAGPWTRKRLMP